MSKHAPQPLDIEASSTSPVISCQHLKKQFKDGQSTIDILSDVNLAVQTRECIAIVGASGSGKSTLLHLLGGLDVPTAGTVHVFTHCLSKQSETQRGRLRNQYLGFVYQFHHLLPEFNVIENVAMPLLIGGTAVEEARARAAQSLDQVGLSHRCHYQVGKLSGGERQRVAMARAVVTEPACVLADEPTGNLDVHTAETLYALIRQLNDRLGMSFVIVTHDHQLARRMDRKLTLRKGHLEE